MLDHMVRLHKRGNSRGVNIPGPVLAAMGWQVGDLVQILVVDGGVMITRPKLESHVSMRPKPRRGRAE